jgi:hypothetical protein
MNTLIFYNTLLLALLCVFIPSVYNYMYSSFIGRIVILVLIAYFSKVNFYLALVFITIIIIKSANIYEGFEAPSELRNARNR